MRHQPELTIVSCPPVDRSDSYSLARMILSASDREQRIVGQELHDGVCQELAGIAFLMQSMQRKIQANGRIDATEAAEVTQMLCKAVSHARGLSHGLYPVAPEANGLAVALQRLAEDTADAHGVCCNFRDCPVDVRVCLNEFVATNIFRIAQELVRNAIHMRRARSISISLLCAPAMLELCVSDNGTSLPPETRSRESDVSSLIAHRARLIGATLRQSVGSDHRTRVECRLPLESGQTED